MSLDCLITPHVPLLISVLNVVSGRILCPVLSFIVRYLLSPPGLGLNLSAADAAQSQARPCSQGAHTEVSAHLPSLCPHSSYVISFTSSGLPTDLIHQWSTVPPRKEREKSWSRPVCVRHQTACTPHAQPR